MIRVACLSYNNAALSNFYHDNISIDYYDDIDIIDYKVYDVVIIINDKNNVDTVKCIRLIRKKYDKILYLADREYDHRSLGQIFESGADDYLLYPIVNAYLIQKIFRDYYKDKSIGLNYYKFQGLRIDFVAHVVMIDYDEIKLTKMEFELLKLLVTNKNATFTKEELLKKVWGFESGDTRTVETHIKTLRKKLKVYKSNIVTVWSYGYSYTENARE